MEIKPGYYQLTRDVQNPHADRRVNPLRNVAKAAFWPKGTRVQVLETEKDKTTLAIEFPEYKYRISNRILSWDDAFALLTEALDPVTESFSEFLTRVSDDLHIHHEILEQLHKQGLISLDDIEVAATVVLANTK